MHPGARIGVLMHAFSPAHGNFLDRMLAGTLPTNTSRRSPACARVHDATRGLLGMLGPRRWSLGLSTGVGRKPPFLLDAYYWP
ncbi:hypothetical protein LX36DRAFT_653496 [Colletotrichum falcatum]|nr:hypothetical protein LX36DRAFT_653496 [Colletotrichum falcatum]